MAPVSILKFGVSCPSDTTPLEELRRAGYEPSQVLGLVGKCEGNGCVNDFSRTLSATVWEPLLPEQSITVFSGGTEGVLSPHVNFIVQETPETNTGLVAAVGRTRDLAPHEIGTPSQARQVAATVRDLITDLGITKTAIGLVLVKCPLLTSAKMSAIRAAGRTPATTDTYTSMAKSRYAAALGVSLALDELPDSELDAVLLDQPIGATWSRVASCSSGAELEDNHILVLALSSSSSPSPGGGHLGLVSGSMRDAIDAETILSLLDQVKAMKGGKVVQVFAKAEASPSGEVRGYRHTMNTDSDIQSTRHARAAVGGLIAGLTGDCHVYVSGGAEGQGPPGGGSLCVVYSCDG